MATDTTVRARIDGQIKDQTADVLADIGLTISDAIRLMLVRVAAEETLPFAVRVPNADTVAAMEEDQQGSLPFFNSVDELMADLNAPD